jgi:hypothetical protein
MVQRIVIAGGQRIQILGQDLFESIQKACEVKRSGGIPHRECRMVWPYQSPHIDPAVDRLWLENLPESSIAAMEFENSGHRLQLKDNL